MITILRIRVPPEKGTLAYKRLRGILDIPLLFRMHTGEWVESTAKDILSPLRVYITSPVLSSYLITLIQTIPLPATEGDTLKIEAVEKEVLASTEQRNTTIFNWSTIFSYDPRCRDVGTLCERYIVDPKISTRIFHLLRHSKKRLQETLFYPHYSHKTLGERSTQDVIRIWQEDDVHFDGGTTRDLEVLYHRHGIQVSGITELRVAFKYNDLRPRCYFAQGPSQYYSSRYIQDILNIILDSIPCVHRETRFEISGIRVTEDEALFIYDYSSFTSNLVELRNFTTSLADFYRGTKVSIFDSRQGVIEVDLGDIFDEYNESCNNYPAFEIRSSLDPEAFKESLEFHHHAGMLGVPGNISSSTLLHGIHLMVLCMSMYVRCVGDDAIGGLMVVGNQGISDLHTSLENLGDIAIEKMQFWQSTPLEEEDLDSVMWNYTKRPICRTGERALLDPKRIVFPSFGTLFPEKADKDHSIGPRRKREEIAQALVSFVRQFHHIDLLDTERVLVGAWLDQVLFASGLKELTKTGTYSYTLGLLFPRNVDECNPEALLERCYVSREVLVIPDLHAVQEEPCKSRVFVHKSKRVMKYIIDFGYGSRSLKMRKGMARDLYEDLRVLMFDRYSLLYDCVVTEDCPDFMFDLFLDREPEVEDEYYISNLGDVEEMIGRH